MTTKVRNYRLETTFKDGLQVSVSLQAENDWKALDTLLCTAQEAVLLPANNVTTFCLLKERADGSWGRIARIVSEGEPAPTLVRSDIGRCRACDNPAAGDSQYCATDEPDTTDRMDGIRMRMADADDEGARIAAEAAQKDTDES